MRRCRDIQRSRRCLSDRGASQALRRAGRCLTSRAALAALSILALAGCTPSPPAGIAADRLTTDPNWLTRISGTDDAHFVTLPPSLSRYGDAWVYQFGDGASAWSTWTAHTSTPGLRPDRRCASTADCPATFRCIVRSGAALGDCHRSNMECGPASVQMLEQLSGRPRNACNYQDSVPACVPAHPNVHSECRSAGSCGTVSGFRPSSWLGNGASELATVLTGLGYTTTTFGGSDPITLRAIKDAIDRNHPVIVALDPSVYDEETHRGAGTTSHFVVVIGYGSTCENEVFHDSVAEGRSASGFVYLMDPGYMNSTPSHRPAHALVNPFCVSEETFNAAVASEGTASGVEAARPGVDETLPTATWYPPGTVLRIDAEYYYVGQPDPVTFAPTIRHASPEALAVNRIVAARAIDASHDVLLCMTSLGELDPAVARWREYQDPGSTHTIYLVDTISRTRTPFLNPDAYATYGGHDEWLSATAGEIALWSSFPRSGTAGIAPGTLVTTDAPGVSTVWVVSTSTSGLRVRLPIFDESAARAFGYDLGRIGTVGVAAQVHAPDLDLLAGVEGQTLTEEMSRDCLARRCLAAIDCFDRSGSTVGGGGPPDGEDPGVGDGACAGADCSMIEPELDAATDLDAAVAPLDGGTFDAAVPIDAGLDAVAGTDVGVDSSSEDGGFDASASCPAPPTRSCYPGPSGTAGVGLCRPGVESCAAGVWAVCSGALTPALEVENCGNGVDDDCAGWPDLACDTVPSVTVPASGRIEVIVNDPRRYVALVDASACDAATIVLPTAIVASGVTPRLWCYATPQPSTSTSPFVSSPPASTVFRQMWDGFYTFATSAPLGDERRTRVLDIRPATAPTPGWAFGVVLGIHESSAGTYSVINASNVYPAAPPDGNVWAIGTNSACPGSTDMNGRIRTRRLAYVSVDASGATTMALGPDDALEAISVVGTYPACQCGASAHVVGTPMPAGWVGCGALPAW